MHPLLMHPWACGVAFKPAIGTEVSTSKQPPASVHLVLVQILEYADLAGAEVLRAYCLAVAICNLVRPMLLHSLPLHALLQQT